jgi:hypothetical protein
MRIHLRNPSLLPDLVEFLRARFDAVIDEASEDEIEISLLGSWDEDAMRMQIYLQIRAWEVAHGAAVVEIVD